MKGEICITNKVFTSMLDYFKGDAKRIQHFTKVYTYASMIGKMEKLSNKEQNILEIAALMHDIGIRPAEEKYGSCSGKLQEQEGPAEAEKILTALHVDEAVKKRVLFLIAHHHTYSNIIGKDYQILVEADFLVNLYEDTAGEETVKSAYNRIFRTVAGRYICSRMFAL
ncbi:HD domain-containing protein [Pectinatus sottacetonis]|uniref:HD domain-containing protein n=1 Tax=Pectinatus sottacetonis TaxID=1002795 RepID=UPI001E597415|nr:HD domain-containing protein [Pectinatus sottacetonis]